MVESIRSAISPYPSPKKASEAAAEHLSNLAQENISEKGLFTLALSGGNTPRLMYSLLGSKYAKSISWDSVHVFWGDERLVPESHLDSNFDMAYRTFLSQLPIPEENIHPIPTEIGSAEKIAKAYENILRDFFRTSSRKLSQTFDLILLGVGKDGHTASLFPSSPALEEENRWVEAVEAPPSITPRKRITLTLPVINQSEIVFFLVFGKEKREVIQHILEEPERAKEIYPAASVSAKKKTVWYVDKNVQNDVSNIP